MGAKLNVRLFAEALGTGLLVTTVVGSGMMATSLTQDAALQLLTNAAATGAMLVVLITVFGPLSGAHFNPAVSLVFALRRELGWRELGPYVAAQCAGGMAGVALAHTMFGLPALEIGSTPRASAGLWLSETVATFALVLAILGSLRARPEATPALVALTIVAAYWFTASTSFANPAVTLARGFTNSFSGIALVHAPAFMAMQVIGALLGLAASQVLFGPSQQHRLPS